VSLPIRPSKQAAIVDPSLRPLEPLTVSPVRRRFALLLLVLGFALVVGGVFVSFGQWLFIAGSILIIIGLFLFGKVRDISEKPDDIRKLYGHND
jgi:hypothetical protein